MGTPIAANVSSTRPDLDFDSIPDILPEKFLLVVVLSVAEALEYMHARSIAHLDIRPANIFISDSSAVSEEVIPVGSADICSGVIDGSLQLKLGDFGICSSFSDANNASEGDSRYCAKELLEGVDGSSSNDSARCCESSIDLSKADIFSLGASVYELCKGCPLAADGSTLDGEWHELRRGNMAGSVMRPYSLEFTGLLSSLLRSDPQQRPSATSVIRVCKSAISSIDENEVLNRSIPRTPTRSAMFSTPSPSSEKSRLVLFITNCIQVLGIWEK